jgi:DNA-binding NtrC family response regulator
MTTYLRYYLNLNTKSPTPDNLPTLENLKKEYIDYLLKLTDKNINKTAEILDISQTALLDKLNKYKTSR